MRLTLTFISLFIVTNLFATVPNNMDDLTPIANFSVSSQSTCINQIITFTDLSSNTPTSWTWTFAPTTVTFQNGTSANSQTPQVSFNTSGQYTVTLNVVNADGSNSSTQSITIYGTAMLPFSENFATTVAPSNWLVINPDASKGWESVIVSGSDGNPTQVARMDNYQYNAPGQLDDLIMPSINLAGMSNPILYFDVAYAPYSVSFFEQLHIEYSTNCGATFAPTSYTKASTILATTTFQTNGWAPSTASDWRTESVDLTNYKSSQTILKFVQTAGYGNGLFIDNVRISDALLPIELASFKGKSTDCNTTIDWIATTETNFSHYELEHSVNGYDFNFVATIESKSNIVYKSYQYLHKTHDAHNYYRLKIIDIDGTYTYSNIIFVMASCSKNNPLTIYPNPSLGHDLINMRFFSQDMKDQISIIDLLGQTVKTITCNTQLGWNTIQLNIKDLPVGSYYIKQMKTNQKQLFLIQK